jgi:hypothetical protein
MKCLWALYAVRLDDMCHGDFVLADEGGLQVRKG